MRIGSAGTAISPANDHLGPRPVRPVLYRAMRYILWWKAHKHTDPASNGELLRSGPGDRASSSPASKANEGTASSWDVGAHSSRPRHWPWRVCACLAVPLLLIGNLGTWVSWNIVDTSNFVATTREVLAREDVREAVATQIADNLLPRSPIVRAATQSSLVSAVTRVLGNNRSQAILDGVATQLHLALTRGERPGITIESRELQTVMLETARIVAPERFGNLALEGGTLRIELFSRADLPSFEPAITLLRWGWAAATVFGAFLVIVPLFVRRDRWSVRLAGLALLATSLLTYALIPLASWIIPQQVTDPQARIVIAGILEGFSRGLAIQTALILLAGLLLCIYGFRPLRRQPGT